MAYITLTPNQKRYAESLARDMGMGYADLDTFCEGLTGKPLAKLGKREASYVIDELLRERDAVTLESFQQQTTST